ncbi:hypothetical protein, partial [Mesorhizobium sp.]|uniref:hypothetical protein n=3 Tax=unclassified Mesorhizobium TaxID=325217 RepID=UPI0025D6C147
ADDHDRSPASARPESRCAHTAAGRAAASYTRCQCQGAQSILGRALRHPKTDLRKDMMMWSKIRAWFKDSETVAWARLQMLGGAVLTVLSATDPSLFNQYIPDRWLPLYIVGSGVLTEVLRRLRAKDL